MELEKKIDADKKISQMFVASRTVAILTVISAHTTIKASSFIADLYYAIGSIGVVLFFIMSGYYYKKYSPSELIKKKTVSIVIPWIIIGTVVYGVNTFLNSASFGISEWIMWILGYKTYLYYVVVLLFCFVIFYLRNTAVLIGAIALNAASIALTACGVMDPVINALHITNYLNIFNWIGFFAIGMLLRRINSHKLYDFIVKTRLVWILLSISSTLIISIGGYEIGYFTAIGWLYELISALSIMGLCTFSFMHIKPVSDISEMSYAVYLLHMMFTGIAAKIYGVHWTMSLFANLMVLLFTYLILLLGKFVARKIKLGKVYNLCCGLRTR